MDHINKSHDLYHEIKHVELARVLIESPFSAPTEELRKLNVLYAYACIKDSLERGEAPYASHLFYTQMLNDDIPHERALGIHAGLVWGQAAQKTIAYTDLGVSRGMELGIENAKKVGRPIEYRNIEFEHINEYKKLLDDHLSSSKKTSKIKV